MFKFKDISQVLVSKNATALNVVPVLPSSNRIISMEDTCGLNLSPAVHFDPNLR